jgi:uncharacterized protein YbjQ (UPF0145 family)
MNPIRTSAGFEPVTTNELNTVKSRTPNGVTKMYLIHEALSRARMRLPQAGRTTTSTEATRAARNIALQGRRQAARELGTL